MSIATIVPSVPPQDLSTDGLILSAPRVEYDGAQRPSLGGIPLLAKLGQGGMGAVYYGIHPRLNTEVAVKVLPLHLSQTNPDMVQRFYREAQLAASIKSPHLVTASDVNEQNGLYYLVMEFVSGKSVGNYLREYYKEKRTGFSEDVALDICIAASKGLAVAHAEGIVHRDIKPDNIMLPKPKGKNDLNFKGAKLMDLGLARGGELNAQGLTGTQFCLGTPGYMAPEQAAASKSCGPPADIFSMGATLYTMLAAEVPFSGSSAMQILLDTAQKPHAPIHRGRPDVSQATSVLIDHCLSKYPNKRFANGAALLEALKLCRATLGQPESAQNTAVEQIREVLKAKEFSPQDSTLIPATMPKIADVGEKTVVTRPAPPMSVAKRAAPPARPTPMTLFPPEKPSTAMPYVIGMAAVLFLGLGLGVYWAISGSAEKTKQGEVTTLEENPAQTQKPTVKEPAPLAATEKRIEPQAHPVELPQTVHPVAAPLERPTENVPPPPAPLPPVQQSIVRERPPEPFAERSAAPEREAERPVAQERPPDQAAPRRRPGFPDGFPPPPPGFPPPDRRPPPPGFQGGPPPDERLDPQRDEWSRPSAPRHAQRKPLSPDASPAEVLQRQIDERSDAMDDLKSTMENADRQSAAKEKQLDELYLRAQDIRHKSFNVAPQVLKQLDQEHDQLTAKINIVKDEIENLKKNKDESNAKMFQLKSEIDKSKRELEELRAK